MKRILLAVCIFLVAVPVLAWVTRGPVGVLLMWALTGYLVVRAWPGIRADVTRLNGHRFSVPFKRHERQGLL